MSTPPGSLRQFTVSQYTRMMLENILTEDDRVELLEGWIVIKPTHNPPHDGSIQLASNALSRHLPEGYDIRIQSVIETTDSVPEPDLVMLRGNERSYVNRYPIATDIAVLIEVAVSSLIRDREVKGRLYARAAITVYWIVNLVDQQVEVYTDPTGPAADPAYRTRQDYRAGDSVPLVVEGRQVALIAVADLLP